MIREDEYFPSLSSTHPPDLLAGYSISLLQNLATASARLRTKSKGFIFPLQALLEFN